MRARALVVVSKVVIADFDILTTCREQMVLPNSHENINIENIQENGTEKKKL